MKKVLVLGSRGMLGHMVYQYLWETKKYRMLNVAYGTSYNTDSVLLDVTNQKAVSNYIYETQPDVVINCIGILIRGSRSNPMNAIYVNSYFPHFLSGIVKEYDGKLIHVSTDCVFSGSRGMYSESDIPDATDTYGRSKALGELINDWDLTLRTSIIGPELKENGEGLFHWFMQSKGEVTGFGNVFWGGVTTLALARVIDICIEQKITGLQHVTNGQRISKLDLLRAFKVLWNKDIEIVPQYTTNKDSSIVTNRMDPICFEASYFKMLEDLAYWMKRHPSLYKQYNGSIH